jgi:hypothetical protein
MGTYTFQIISDDRFAKYSTPDIQTDNDRQRTRISALLNSIPRITFVMYEPRLLTWPDGNRQIRTNVYISKTSRKLTWNYIFGLINQTIPAPVYDRILPTRGN